MKKGESQLPKMMILRHGMYSNELSKYSAEELGVHEDYVKDNQMDIYRLLSPDFEK